MNLEANQTQKLRIVTDYLEQQSSISRVELSAKSGVIQGLLTNELCGQNPHSFRFFLNDSPTSMVLHFPEVIYLSGPAQYSLRVAKLNYNVTGVLGKIGLDNDGELSMAFVQPMQCRAPTEGELNTFRDRLPMILAEVSSVHSRAVGWVLRDLGFDPKSVDDLLAYARDCLSLPTEKRGGAEGSG